MLNRSWLHGYKRWSTNRKAPHAYTQPEGIRYLARAVFYGRSNFANFWTKTWSSKQPKAMNDTLDRHFSTYSRSRRRVLLQALFGFWELAPCPVKLHLRTFGLCKSTVFKNRLGQALHCPSYNTLLTGSIPTERYFWFKEYIRTRQH